MTEHFYREFEKLKRKLLAQGGSVEDSLKKACKAINDMDSALAQQVKQGDSAIDTIEVEIEEDCLKILALYQPVASDLRYLGTILKVNNELERIGDLSVSVANRVAKIQADSSFEMPAVFGDMCTACIEMLTDSLNALVEHDADKARRVCAQDDVVDQGNVQIKKMVRNQLQEGSQHVDALLHLLTLSTRIERAADHVTNIAEDIIYLVEGAIVRHQHTE